MEGVLADHQEVITAIRTAIHDVYDATLSVLVSENANREAETKKATTEEGWDTDADNVSRTTISASTTTLIETPTERDKAVAYEAAKHVVLVLEKFGIILTAVRGNKGRVETGDLLANFLVEWYCAWVTHRTNTAQSNKAETECSWAVSDSARADEMFTISNISRNLCISMVVERIKASSFPLERFVFWYRYHRSAFSKCCSMPVPKGYGENDKRCNVLQAFTSPHVLQTWATVQSTLLPLFARSCTTASGNYSLFYMVLIPYKSYAWRVLENLDRGDFDVPSAKEQNNKQQNVKSWWKFWLKNKRRNAD